LAKKILVIDDSALMRRVISDIINSGGDYEVAAIARDGVEGFDLILIFTVPLSLILTCLR
jgi:two-component system chemotaxis response regulator CheB